jgi:quercetin dioxygenase-like cupin family protein
MKRILSKPARLAIASIAALVLASMAQAQEAPKDNKGFTTLKSEVVDLGPEIAGMEGRQLRLRLLRIEPGGHIGVHSHKDRPAVVYFLTGADTVHSGDRTSKVFKPGDTGSANHATTHWHRNDGQEDVLFIAVDILNKQK